MLVAASRRFSTLQIGSRLWTVASGAVAAVVNLVTLATDPPPPIYGTARRGPTSLVLGWTLPIRARVKGLVGRWTNWWRSTQHHVVLETDASALGEALKSSD